MANKTYHDKKRREKKGGKGSFIPFAAGNPGKPKGATNKATPEVKAFAAEILESEEYRNALKKRIIKGSAIPVEILLYYYRYGKPKIRVEVTPPPGLPMARMLSMMSASELELIYRATKRVRGMVIIESEAQRELPETVDG